MHPLTNTNSPPPPQLLDTSKRHPPLLITVHQYQPPLGRHGGPSPRDGGAVQVYQRRGGWECHVGGGSEPYVYGAGGGVCDGGGEE